MRLINNYHFQEIELPARGVLKMQGIDRAAQAVAVAQKHPDLLMGKLTQFVELLERDGGFFHEEQTAARRYLAVLKNAR